MFDQPEHPFALQACTWYEYATFFVRPVSRKVVMFAPTAGKLFSGCGAVRSTMNVVSSVELSRQLRLIAPLPEAAAVRFDGAAGGAAVDACVVAEAVFESPESPPVL